MDPGQVLTGGEPITIVLIPPLSVGNCPVCPALHLALSVITLYILVLSRSDEILLLYYNVYMVANPNILMTP